MPECWCWYWCWSSACEDAEDAEDADVDADASSNTRELHTSKRTVVPWMVSSISYCVLRYLEDQMINLTSTEKNMTITKGPTNNFMKIGIWEIKTNFRSIWVWGLEDIGKGWPQYFKFRFTCRWNNFRLTTTWTKELGRIVLQEQTAATSTSQPSAIAQQLTLTPPSMTKPHSR